MRMKRSIGIVVLQVALAFFLLMGGVTGLIYSNAGEFQSVVRILSTVIHNAFLIKIIVIMLMIFEILAGVFLIASLFTFSSRVVQGIYIFFILLWMVNIIFVDFVGAFNTGLYNVNSLFAYFHQLALHLMILGSLLTVHKYA